MFCCLGKSRSNKLRTWCYQLAQCWCRIHVKAKSWWKVPVFRPKVSHVKYNFVQPPCLLFFMHVHSHACNFKKEWKEMTACCVRQSKVPGTFVRRLDYDGLIFILSGAFLSQVIFRTRFLDQWYMSLFILMIWKILASVLKHVSHLI